MIERPLWSARLTAGWKQASLVWLTGPGRVGKTVLAQSLPDAEFLNCEWTSAGASSGRVKDFDVRLTTVVVPIVNRQLRNMRI
jgi:hypothetical protein